MSCLDEIFSSHAALSKLFMNFSTVRATTRCDLAYPELCSVMFQLVSMSLAAFAEQYPKDMASIVEWLISRRFAS
jgi:hypothetical protein